MRTQLKLHMVRNGMYQDVDLISPNIFGNGLKYERQKCKRLFRKHPLTATTAKNTVYRVSVSGSHQIHRNCILISGRFCAKK